MDISFYKFNDVPFALKKILTLLSKISILALEKIVPGHPYKFLLSLQERSGKLYPNSKSFSRLSLEDLFKKSLQINVSPKW